MLIYFACEAAGASIARHSLHPPISEGAKLQAILARNAQRDREATFLSSRRQRSDPVSQKELDRVVAPAPRDDGGIASFDHNGAQGRFDLDQCSRQTRGMVPCAKYRGSEQRKG